jgi:hypothetical protein
MLSIREYYPLSQFDDFRLPQLVGMTLAAAEEAVDPWRLKVRTEDASASDRRAWIASNWTVVDQHPVKGEPMREGQVIKLQLLKNEESDSAVASSLSYDFHEYESRFTGTVTGYGRSGEADWDTVVVDDVPVRLDLIEPVREGCGFENTATARAAKEALLPVGSQVIFVRSEEGSSYGFIHPVGAATNVDSPASPEYSANEALVRGGWWAPSRHFTGGFGGWSTESVRVSFEKFSPNASSLNEVQKDYAPFIADAGNAGVSAAIGGLGVCRGFEETKLGIWEAASAEYAERDRLWQIQYEQRVRTGYYSCRDGDGDGFCNER